MENFENVDGRDCPRAVDHYETEEQVLDLWKSLRDLQELFRKKSFRKWKDELDYTRYDVYSDDYEDMD